MRPGGGHAKGAKFERKMARILSRWWYRKPGYLWRRPGPGTAFFKKDKHRHSGDIVPSVDRRLPSPFPFHVELKCFSKGRLKLHYLLWPNLSPIKKIWRKTIAECRRDLTPMLLLKANLVPIVCVMRVTDAVKLVGAPSVRVMYYQGTLDEKEDMIIFPWEDLLKAKARAKARVKS